MNALESIKLSKSAKVSVVNQTQENDFTDEFTNRLKQSIKIAQTQLQNGHFMTLEEFERSAKKLK